MPSIKDFEKMKKPSERTIDPEAAVTKPKKARRRPGRDEMSASAVSPTEPVAEDAHVEEEPTTSARATDNAQTETSRAESAPGRTPLNFYGAEVLRERMPAAFEIVEAVAEEWTKDGSFQELPIPHPVAQMAAQMSLRKAKDLEKKLEEKGVFMIARMGLEFAKSKLNRR